MLSCSIPKTDKKEEKRNDEGSKIDSAEEFMSLFQE